MCRCLKPQEFCDSIYSYDFEKARKRGVSVVFLDIDNTLVPHDAPSDERSERLMKQLQQQGFRLCILSNNEEPRVRKFAACADVPYRFKAGKPSPSRYLEVMRDFGVQAEACIAFGDQLFTDIWGANNAGVHSILVKPLDPASDKPHIKLKRILEKPFLAAFFAEKRKR